MPRSAAKRRISARVSGSNRTVTPSERFLATRSRAGVADSQWSARLFESQNAASSSAEVNVGTGFAAVVHDAIDAAVKRVDQLPSR